MTAAADALDMSRAMVTRYLAQMEQWAGARLLHRTTRRLSLTDAGEQTLARCRPHARSRRPRWRSTSDAPRPTCRAACCAWPAPSRSRRTCWPRRWRSSCAAIRSPRSTCTSTRRTVNLVEERIDLAIRITNDLDPNLIARPLGHCASVICASPAYLAAHGTPRSAARAGGAQLPDLFVLRQEPVAVRARGRAQSPCPSSGNLSANESRCCSTAAIEGAGIAMQPVYSAARADRAAGGSWRCLPELSCRRRLGVYGAVRLPPPDAGCRLRAMLDFLVRALRRCAATGRRSGARSEALKPPARRRGTARARNRTA